MTGEVSLGDGEARFAGVTVTGEGLLTLDSGGRAPVHRVHIAGPHALESNSWRLLLAHGFFAEAERLCVQTVQEGLKWYFPCMNRWRHLLPLNTLWAQH